ncbi:MAG: hypothetical protein HY858_00640 [Candidatus Solibacter usitatus]|nr:hypothetical protein [Candidatus Solibacter usitatus]
MFAQRTTFKAARLRACLLGMLTFAGSIPLHAQTTGATFGDVVRLGGTPSDIVLDESRSRLYLVNQNANRVDVWDYSIKARLTSIPVGRGPLAAAMDMDSRYLYVTNAGSQIQPDSTLTVIDLGANQILTTVSLPARPQGVEVGLDGRVLISTLGTGANNAFNTLLLYDRNQASQQVTSIPVPPPPVTPPALGTTQLSRPVTAFNGALRRTPSGEFIIGLSVTNNGANTIAFVYEVASGMILKSRNVTGQSTVIAMASDGARFMAGFTMYNTNTLAVTAQQSIVTSPFPFPAGANFNSLQNLGGAAYSPDGATLYSAFNVAPFAQPPSRPLASTLLVSDAQNLGIKLGIRMPESIVARMVITSDGSEAWGLSESGLIHLPLANLYDYPIIQPETTTVFMAVDGCNRGIASARLRVNNLGKGKLTFAVPNLNASLIAQADSGLAPSSITLTMDPGRSGVVRQPGTNLSFNFGLNGAPLVIDLISPEAINIPNRIKVYMNYRTSDMRGMIYPIPTGLNLNHGLRDIQLDESRGRAYITNAGFNRIEVFDLKLNRLLDPINVCQMPQKMALSTDGGLLYVACSNGVTGDTGGTEGVGMVDLELNRYIGEVEFPPLPRQGNAAIIAPQTLAMGITGLQFIMSNGTAWKVTGGRALPRDPSPVLGVQANGAQLALPGPRFMLGSPDFTQVILLAGGGMAYLYDALTDSYTASRQLFSTPITAMYYGPLGISPQNTFMLANGLVLNNSLSPIGGAEKPGQSVTTPGTGGGTTTTIVSAGQRNVAAVAPIDENFFVRLTLPVRQNLNPTSVRDEARTTLELVDVRTGAEQLLGVVPENPTFTLQGQTRQNIPPRWMVVNSAGTTAYAVTLSGLSVIPLVQTTSATRPVIPAGVRGIVNSIDGTQNIKPGSFVTITGQNLGLANTADQIPLPAVMGGSCATMNDIPMPLLSVSPTQINAQIPDTLRPGLYVFQVRSLANAQQSDPIVINVLRP